jgi:hypothetical protein
MANGENRPKMANGKKRSDRGWRNEQLQAKLELLGPLRVVPVEVVLGPPHPDHARPDVTGKRMRSRPVFAVAHRPRFDRVRNEVSDCLERRFGRQQRMGAATSFVEHFFGQTSVGSSAQRPGFTIL